MCIGSSRQLALSDRCIKWRLNASMTASTVLYGIDSRS